MNKDEANTGLEAWRQKIDSLDQKIRTLLAKRITYAQQVAIAKKAAIENDQDNRTVFYRPGREAQMMRDLASGYRQELGAFPVRAAIQVWRELISASIEVQAFGLKVAVADETCKLLAQAHFGAVSRVEIFPGAVEVLQEVEQGQSHIGVVDKQGLIAVSNSPSSANVVALLPFVRPSDLMDRYVIARQPMEKSGDDLLLYRVEDHNKGATGLFELEERQELPENLQQTARLLGCYARPISIHG